MWTTMKLYTFKGDLVSKTPTFMGNIFVELASTIRRVGKAKCKYSSFEYGDTRKQL